jgi:DNA-binding Lrp family transcriptional regulator
MDKLSFDRIDDAILRALQNNARISNKELASEVGLAPSSCLERVRRLQAKGVITGYRASVDPSALGIGLQAFVAVQLATHSRDLVETFRSHLLTRPEVLSVYHMGGENDFLVHVAVRDANHLRDLALDAFTARAEVARIQTALVYENVQPGVWPNYALND